MGFEWAYRSSVPPPWDVDRAQPAFVELARAGGFDGRVLDVGCGTGENALYLASLGLDVTGADAAPTAISIARRKAEERGIRARFEVADALALDGLGPFDTILDCGLFHTFADGQRRQFERSLATVLRPGGRYHMLCFSDRELGPGGPRRITQGEIRGTFRDGWRVDSIEAARFATRDGSGFDPDGPLAWLASLTRLGPVGA